jgi:hypothetical protein
VFIRRLSKVLVLGALLGTVVGACGDDENESRDFEGLDMCCDLGARCHPEEGDSLNSLKQVCHSLGHENDPAKCREQYDACIAECVDDSGEDRHFCEAEEAPERSSY